MSVGFNFLQCVPEEDVQDSKYIDDSTKDKENFQ